MTETIYKLECAHQVRTNVAISLQYPDDLHYIWCPPCRNYNKASYPTTIEWKQIVGVVTNKEPLNEQMRELLRRTPFILPDDILRLQPSLKGRSGRQRPYPYVKGSRP